MKISLNWLKEYIPDLKIDSVNSLAEKMISAGLDIESIEDEAKIFEKFVVGEVVEKHKHPNADNLTLCKVNLGKKILSIVCGAPNVEKGQKVCVALEGAIIPNGGFEIKKSKIRGELSEGMICSERELNLSENHEGILVLNKDAKAGESFADFVKAKDVIFEIGITPNRGDLFSHIGVAREVAAIYDKKISIPEIKISESETNTRDLVNISIENTDLCKRFTGRVINNVKIQESPEWLQRKLKSIGLRPRNNIVDITNYVMFETGQPLHSFDYDKIRGKEIIVKTAKEGDKFVTLDSKERVLNSNSLMVCDGQRYSGIAGIMGGEYSEIRNETTNIFLESAYFDPVSIRKNSKRLALQTDASQRFERGVDINMVEFASLRATQLIQEIAGGEVSKELCDIYPEKFIPSEVALRVSKTNELIGIELSEDELIKILDKIEIKFLKKENNDLIFEIPEFRRADIEREADLIEEVVRIYGYDNIEEDTNFHINVSNKINYGTSDRKLINELTNHFIGRGFNQILTNPLVDEKKIKVFSENDVKLLNSISAEMNSLRPNMIYGMLNVIKNNFNNSGKDISLKLFETGRVFLVEENNFREEDWLIFSLSGKKDSPLIYGGDKAFDVLDIKGEVEMFLSKLNLENYRLFYYNDENFDGARIDISLNDNTIGNIYKVDNHLRNTFEIDSEVFISEFYLNVLAKFINAENHFEEFSKFPSAKRDIAIVIDKQFTYDVIRETIIKRSGNLLKNIELFDLYQDERLGNDKKGMAFSMELASNEKTLTDEEINKVIEGIIDNLESSLGAKLRT